MTPYFADDLVALHLGDCREVMAAMETASVDAVVCDPPYELGFMGRAWDASGIAYDVSVWRECLRLLKPGGYLLAFGGTRTYHRLACAVEDAGFEIRDSLHWLYGSGFPKGKACLKPAHEPITLARKPAKRMEPFPGLDGCRVGTAGELVQCQRSNVTAKFTTARDDDGTPRPREYSSAGRWPPNILLSEDAAAELDRQSGTSTSTGGSRGGKRDLAFGMAAQPDFKPGLGDTGGASRFFPVFRYQAKAPASERPRLADGTAWPTVKPLDLMRWLVRLVTPPGGLVLDPFAGSGTTGQACALEGFRCVLIDRDPVAAELTRTRLSKPVQGTLLEAAS